MSESYPYESGDVIVIGPGCFGSEENGVINWNGINYYRMDDLFEDDSYLAHPPLD